MVRWGGSSVWQSPSSVAGSHPLASVFGIDLLHELELGVPLDSFRCASTGRVHNDEFLHLPSQGLITCSPPPY